MVSIYGNREIAHAGAIYRKGEMADGEKHLHDKYQSSCMITEFYNFFLIWHSKKLTLPKCVCLIKRINLH